MSDKPHILRNTRSFVEALKSQNELHQIDALVDPNLELAEIQRQVVAQKGPALLFTNVKGSRFPVATNLYGSQKRIDIAFGQKPQQLIKQATELADQIFPLRFKTLWESKNLAFDFLKVGKKAVNTGPLLEQQITQEGLLALPQIKSWPEDGGAFITLPLVYTEHPETNKSNLGMYRIQLHNAKQCGMHIQIHRGGGFHHHQAESENKNLPAHIYVGGPPAFVIAAIAPLPEDVPEILLASLLCGERIRYNKNNHSPLPFLVDADFCIAGEIPAHQRMPEGPFGDHYGYYSLQHDYPYLNVNSIWHQKDAIYPATVVGRPPQEDHYIACYLQELLKPLIKMVMPQVTEVWAYEESGVHSLAGAIVKDRYPREALTTALRILGEGQLSLSKVLMVTDQNVDVKNFASFFECILERIRFDQDLFVLSNISQDTLDYTGPKVNEGSKAIFLGIGKPIRKLPKEINFDLPSDLIRDAHVFCPGALAVTATKDFESDKDLVQKIAQHPAFKDWPMVFVLDNAKEAVASSEDFIWHVFTRFEPAADTHAKQTNTNRFHVGLTAPVAIDCRLKPWYPKVLTVDTNTQSNAAKILRDSGLDCGH
ncbi:MAG: UbiD family decarboxylase [Deltaproteobacteria bacterium]|nr:UbiD family decarboxylase [Deltaproteobacteria bacterium]